MIVRVLGSAAGGGVPQWNCGCKNCERARDGRAPVRTQSSIAISGDGKSWALVNASVDLTRQLAQTEALWPRALRENPFEAILLTDANVDHVAGLGELRQSPQPILVVSSAVTKGLLKDQRPYARFQCPPHQWQERIDGLIAGGLAIEMMDVPGFLPGYAGRGVAPGAVVAYIIREPASGAQVTIAPVFLKIDERLFDVVAQSNLALLDGTFYSNDELHAFGSKAKDASSLGHAPVGGSDGTLERIAMLNSRRVFVHVNNTNPMLDCSSSAHAAVTGAGCEIAFDGWEATVGRRLLEAL